MATLASMSCTGPLYKVAPLPKAVPAEATTTTSEALEITAAQITEDRAFQDFEANLPLTGIVAVDVRVTNRSQNPVKLDFVLRSNEGSWKPTKPKSALSRVMKYYGVGFYGKESYKRTVESYESVGLQMGDIAAGEERRGIVFFDAKKAATAPGDMTLEVKGTGQPLLLKLN